LTSITHEHRVRVVTDGAMPHEMVPGVALSERRVRARNLFRDAANRIHDDAGARQHGYAGALVAGVTIYGYLAQLAVEAWGHDWLRRGTATVRFLRPVYDDDELTLSGRVVARSASPAAGETVAELEARSPRGEVAATMVAGLAWGGSVIAPDPHRYPAAALPASPPRATSATLAWLDPIGTPVLALDEAVLGRAADDLGDPSPTYRGADGLLHPGLLLRQANRALSENLSLGPWIHVASDVAHCDLARAGDRLETRGRVARVYERKGRGWADLDLLVVAAPARPIARIRHTAIYHLPAVENRPP
jgi:acyl dehydratase